jgi:hypothetical protein
VQQRPREACSILAGVSSAVRTRHFDTTHACNLCSLYEDTVIHRNNINKSRLAERWCDPEAVKLIDS